MFNLIPIAASLIGGLFAGKKNKQSAEKATKGARLQDILPLIMPMIQQQQQRSGENYAAQQAKYNQTLPLQDAISRMAMNLMPSSAQKPRQPGM